MTLLATRRIESFNIDIKGVYSTHGSACARSALYIPNTSFAVCSGFQLNMYVVVNHQMVNSASLRQPMLFRHCRDDTRRRQPVSLGDLHLRVLLQEC